MKDCPAYELSDVSDSLGLAENSSQLMLDYARDGFVILDSEVPANTLDEAADYMQRSMFNEHGGPLMKRSLNAWSKCDVIREIAASQKVITVLNELYGRRPIPFQTINFPVGSEQPVHSDGFHFNSIPARFVCGVWIALEDIDADNGPLFYYPGSHTLPEYQMLDCIDSSTTPGDFPGFDEYKKFYEPFIQQVLNASEFNRTELSLRKGQVMIWSAGLCHGGAPILDSSRTRLSQITHYFFENCTYYSPRMCTPQSGKLWLRSVCDVRSGDLVPHSSNGRPFLVPEAGRYQLDKNNYPVSLAPFSIKGTAEALLDGLRQRIGQ